MLCLALGRVPRRAACRPRRSFPPRGGRFHPGRLRGLPKRRAAMVPPLRAGRPFTASRETPMARTPNYNQQRNDRDRAKQAKAEAKQREREQRKAEKEAAAVAADPRVADPEEDA